MILGADSNYPIPAGAYKADDRPAKNINVVFGRSVSPAANLELELDLPEESLAGVNLTGKIRIKNSGNVALYQLPVKLDSPRFRSQWEVAVLPPSAATEIQFTLPAAGWTSQFRETLIVDAGSQQVSRRLTIIPAYGLIFGSQAFRLAVLSLTGLVVLKLIHARLVKAKPAL